MGVPDKPGPVRHGSPGAALPAAAGPPGPAARPRPVLPQLRELSGVRRQLPYARPGSAAAAALWRRAPDADGGAADGARGA